MKIRRLTVGPIVGETTPTRVRIWGRGEAHSMGKETRRCFGALQFRKAGSVNWSATKIFKLNPNFDFTGIAVVTNLTKNALYEYRVGYFFSEAEVKDATFNEKSGDWDKIDVAEFKTASDNDNEARTLFIGSCRYLLKTFLGDFWDNRGDKTFRSMLRQIEDGQQIDQVIMMGDQIYADDLNSFNADKTVTQFYERYRDAFSQKYIRKLMSRVPTYMTLDDHEIEDNWPENASPKDLKTVYPNAIHAYQAYQLCHSPNIPISGTQLKGTPKSLWYKYSDGCCDIFVMDSRTERWRPGLPDAAMVSRPQMNALKRWLNDKSGRVKLIVTSVPFVPDSPGEGTDKWAGFPMQRAEILEHLEKHQIRKVVFLSGDVHASMAVQLVSPSGLLIGSVISSAFFWPYPHPDADHFKLSGEIDGGKAGKFKVERVSSVYKGDNFTRLHVSKSKISIEVFERKGAKKRTSEMKLI